MLLCFSLGEDEDSDAAQEDASARDSEDEAEWDRLQADVKGRDPILDPKSKESHIVHAPYFPEVRTDLNSQRLVVHLHAYIYMFKSAKTDLSYHANYKIRLFFLFFAISTGKARVVVDICHGSQENRAYNTASTDI